MQTNVYFRVINWYMFPWTILLLSIASNLLINPSRVTRWRARGGILRHRMVIMQQQWPLTFRVWSYSDYNETLAKTHPFTEITCSWFCQGDEHLSAFPEQQTRAWPVTVWPQLVWGNTLCWSRNSTGYKHWWKGWIVDWHTKGWPET